MLRPEHANRFSCPVVSERHVVWYENRILYMPGHTYSWSGRGPVQVGAAQPGPSPFSEKGEGGVRDSPTYFVPTQSGFQFAFGLCELCKKSNKHLRVPEG